MGGAEEEAVEVAAAVASSMSCLQDLREHQNVSPKGTLRFHYAFDINTKLPAPQCQGPTCSKDVNDPKRTPRPMIKVGCTTVEISRATNGVGKD